MTGEDFSRTVLRTSLGGSMHHALCVVDAFTARPFSGNPAAVCFLEAPAEPAWMRQVAAELNLSETAFLVPRREGWGLRWFTPTVEVELCGHATLASAHALWESGRLAATRPAVFVTERAGVLTCRPRDGGIELDLPARPAAPIDGPEDLVAVLGQWPVWIGASREDLICELADGSAVQNLRPDLARMARWSFRGVSVTAGGGLEGFDFISRFFAPAVGIAEDPVTGSAHATLGPYWAARLGRTALRAWQASPRGGEVRMRVAEDRVVLWGQAVTVWKGDLRT